MQAHRRVVVGVDGSESSEVALRWAALEAEYRGATLVVVTTWTALPPPIVYPYAGFHDRDPGDPREAAMSALGEIVGRVLQDRPNLSVELLAIPGDTAKVLIEQSGDADLVVVGARGTGGVSDWLRLGESQGRAALSLQRCGHPLTADGTSNHSRAPGLAMSTDVLWSGQESGSSDSYPHLAFIRVGTCRLSSPQHYEQRP